MPIKFHKSSQRITLTTKNTMYIMEIIGGRHLGHVYYGKKKRGVQPEFHYRKGSFTPYYEELYDYQPDLARTEYSCFGGGDYRCTSLKIKNGDGNSVTVFDYQKHRIFKGRAPITRMPYAEVKDGDQTLELTLWDSHTECELKLYYTVFEDCDVISRYMKITNKGKTPVDIEKCMSLQCDLLGQDYDLITLYGAHNRERMYNRNPMRPGGQSIYSRRGASSHQFNPFMGVCCRDTTEEKGECFGFNLVYSGNFLGEAEMGQEAGCRVQLGLGGDNFGWHLTPGETFESPEAVMTYTDRGIGQMSRNYHKFTRERILPEEIFENRPVVLNTWEAVYFNIDEKVLLDFAAKSAKYKIDMLVMDDGWFGAREHDHAGLGDWWANPAKFRDGLKTFVDRVKQNGLKFGIWIEPEMVNPDSELFRNHPEWTLRCPGRENMLSRSQLVLDMSNPDVVDYLKQSFEQTLGDVAIDYIKWDMNRHLSEVGSDFLPPERQKEVAHRYMLGTYDLYRWFRERFSHVMIENCSGGGGRYDLGMMKYSQQIWASDNTNPVWRTKIQYGSTVPYPVSTMSCHVSHPGDSVEEMDYRYTVAINGMLGYEMNILKMDDKILDRIPEQIAQYRGYEKLIKTGDYYRLTNPNVCNHCAYYFVDETNDNILLTFVQIAPDVREKEVKLKISRAELGKTYVDKNTGDRYTGAELRRGISVKTHTTDERFCRMWELVKE